MGASLKNKWVALSTAAIVLIFVSQAAAQQRQGKAINLEALNTPMSDLAPIISADGNTIYFTSDRPGGVGRQDFWTARRQGGDWTKPVNIPELNTAQNEGPDAIGLDGKTLYFTGCNRRKDGSDKCDIYVAKMGDDGKWGKVENLGPPINTENEEANASISPDGKTLYFTSDRPGGQGGYDIWQSTLGGNGKWSNPVNLGPVVNTSAWEGISFAYADGVTLYFSSNGHGGFGNADIFRTTRKADGTWTEPENLGGLINSAYNDIYFTFPASGDLVYFSSSSEEGFGREDIYAIPKNLILESPGYIVVRGRVTDAQTGQPIAAMLNVTSTNMTQLNMTSNAKTGNYMLRLKINDSYRIHASAQGYMDKIETVDLRNADPFHIVVRDIQLNSGQQVASAQPLPVENTEQPVPDNMEEILIDGGKIRVSAVLFDFDKATLKQEAVNVLERLVKFMKDNPSVVLKVDGFTDSVGSDDYNMKLSQRRASAVKQYLTLRGVPGSRVRAEGHGENNLVEQDDPNGGEGNPKNRRVEFSLAKGTYTPTHNPNTTMNGKAPPENVINVVASAVLNPNEWVIPENIEVRTAVVASDMVNGRPMGAGNSFESGIGRVYFYTRIIGAVDTATVTHKWYYKGKLVRTVPINVKSPDYRTSSYLSVDPSMEGPVRVVCLGPDGTILRTLRFSLTR